MKKSIQILAFIYILISYLNNITTQKESANSHSLFVINECLRK
ncbi:hypothetical protein ACUW54_002414 [Staphylococcus cohnii]